MKTCPICNARCFDDMEICYGCMHPFVSEERSGEKRVDALDTVDKPQDPKSRIDRDSEARLPEDAMKAKSSPRDSPRVFGALDEDETPWREERMEGEVDSAVARFVGNISGAIAQLEPVEGPLAMASLGNGYRLVLEIERE